MPINKKVQYSSFIAPGLIMMTMLQNSFANGASSIGQSKFQGNIVDILMAPLSDYERATGYIFGAIARGVICGLATFIVILFFVPLSIHSYFALFSLFVSIMYLTKTFHGSAM